MAYVKIAGWLGRKPCDDFVHFCTLKSKGKPCRCFVGTGLVCFCVSELRQRFLDRGKGLEKGEPA